MLHLASCKVACTLHDLHDHNEDDDRSDHDIVLVALIAVADRDITQTAGTDATCHRRVTQDGDEYDRETANERRQRLTQEYLVNDLPGVRAETLRRFHQATIDLFDRLLDHPRDEGSQR